VRRIRDVIEPTAETHLLGNHTAAIDGDVAEASVRVRVHQVCVGAPSRQRQKILGCFRAKLVRTGKGWRFRYFGPVLYSKVVAQELLSSRLSVVSS
jgi:SnoaL-like protein